MTIRLIVTDLDGTLLGADKRISRRNIRALTACRGRGIRIALASGRSARATGSVAAQAGLSDSLIISSNGARMDESSGGPILMEDCIEPDTAREAARRLIRAGIYVECYADGRIYMVNRTPLKNHCHRPGPTGGGDVFFEGE